MKFGASLDWVWTFALDPVGDGRTRMLIRNRGRVSPRWLDLAYNGFSPASGSGGVGWFGWCPGVR